MLGSLAYGTQECNTVLIRLWVSYHVSVLVWRTANLVFLRGYAHRIWKCRSIFRRNQSTP